MLTTEHYEELSRQALVAQAAAINEAGRRHLVASALAKERSARREDYEAKHERFLKVDFASAIEYATYSLGLLAIYGIDVFLFGASAEYVAGLLGGGGDLWSYVAKWVVPACFLGIEVLISLKIAKAREAEQFEFGSGAARKAWLALGILVALVMPLAAAATAQSVQIVAESQVPVLMVAVLAIISFAAHVLVLFGGRLAQDAKTCIACKVIHTFQQVREARAKQVATETLTTIGTLFIHYVHAWRVHNRKYESMPSGPFDRDVVELLRRQFPQVANGGGSLTREAEE